ncbi:hypothetical protein L917_11134, partial [Phytophthora nicotianae]
QKRQRKEKQKLNRKILWLNKRAKRLFDKEMKITDMSSIENTREVPHVELMGTSAVAVMPLIEYVYTFKVPLLHNTSARET